MNTTIRTEKMNPNWDDSLLLGIETIDKQHNSFFTLLNEIISLSENNDNENKVLNLLSELEMHSECHFKTEEALMREANSPNMEEHINQHNLFQKKTKDFMVVYSYGNKVLINKITAFMKQWLITHIREYDADYAKCVKTYYAQKAMFSH
jgi:hemerythrin-like metal-binding protein|nr:hemerythrin family protein [uncultured Bacteroides sp.]